MAVNSKSVVHAEEHLPQATTSASHSPRAETDKPLASGGNVWVWGADGGTVPSAGSSPADSLVPRLAAKLSGKGIKGLAFGDKAAAAVTNKGELYLWRVGEEEPTLTEHKGVQQVACGRNGLIAALTDKGDVLLWDARTHAEGGLHPPASSKEAGSKAGAETITQVDCGSGHVAMVTSRGRVLVLGDNNYGQLSHIWDNYWLTVWHARRIKRNPRTRHAILLDDGAVFMLGSVHLSGLKGSTLYTDSPVLVPLTRDSKSVEKLGRIIKLSCGGEHTLALTNYGVLLAWGNGMYGQVPDNQGKHINTAHPVLRAPFFNAEGKEFINNEVKELQCGNEHCLALTKGGDVWSFGRNDRGQCGVGNRAHQKTPHKVTKLQSRKDKISAIACGQHTSAAIEE
ncbi:regulator of chromosome condensation (RCC1) repeat domain containing protein [Acanthamoeba castellanii str. Neff]|uniref:Regulator of chromosome condensation (RCC1) repeat domain containing protein n=1 Tax=Acanthamoeba castellanii (strain ATCC 30010 / Neff) TaxID=1257118 RepID=L8GTY9_ACACF|nr:regulator of chromosome condensation (RCC1) repeat domain containing protein [Acanthamoeba castellanii str. Neff]ELR15571.1 regulator of chromosome condensation (RCC1) repeat domain containing protein [Acanthamoeba castellanii str. Neff]